MAGDGRRRRFPDRLAWIRRRTWSKQRGAKLRSSGSKSDGNPDPVVKPVLHDGDAASKVALKVGGGGDGGTRSPKVRDGGDGGSCGPNIVEACGGGGDDVISSPMLGCCGCNQIRKHLVVEEGGCEGTCALNLGCCNCDGSREHVIEMALGDGIEQVRDGRNVRGRRIGRARVRADPEGQLYVLDSEAEDSALEECCRPVLRRGQGAFGRRLAATGEVALEAGTGKAVAVAGGEMTEEMVECMEQWLTGIEQANREVFILWIKVFLFTVLLRKIQIKWVASIMNCCIIKEARSNGPWCS